MPDFKDEFFDYDHLRFLSGRGLTNPLRANFSSPTPKKHIAHNYTSDYFDFSLNYTGRWGKYIGSWGSGKTNSFRQIDTALYEAILRKYPSTGVALPSNFAISIPGTKGRGLSSAGLIFPNTPKDPRITEELFDNSKPYSIMPSITGLVTNLYSKAVKLGKEQSAYIVLDHKALKLLFTEALPAEINSSSGTHIKTNLNKQKKNGQDTKVRTLLPPRPDYDTKQVIGTLHTHYYLTKREELEDGTIKITKMGYEPSKDDKQDALSNNFVNYIIDDKFIHSADQYGRVRTNLSRSLNLLVDCLQIFSGMY